MPGSSSQSSRASRTSTTITMPALRGRVPEGDAVPVIPVTRYLENSRGPLENSRGPLE